MKPDPTLIDNCTKKKNLIVVGNKPPRKAGLAEEIDSFDFVLRINRMNHLGAGGNRIDGLFFEANSDFKYKYFGGAHRSMIKKASKILMKKMWFERFDNWSQYLASRQYNKIEIIDESFAIKDTGGFPKLTSSIILLGYLINSHWSTEYNIHITCLDVEKRANILDNDPTWNFHKGAGPIEQAYLEKQLQLHNLIRVYDE